MKSFYDLVSQRRSIRKFTPEPLLPEQIETILKAGLKSPSSKNAKPWDFIVIENKDTLESLSTSKTSGSKMIKECAVAIVITADPTISNVWIEDTSIATIMMQLQAEDLGLGSCWIQIKGRQRADESDSEDYVKNILNLPIQQRVLAILVIGNKVEAKPAISDDNLAWEKVHIDKYKTK